MNVLTAPADDVMDYHGLSAYLKIPQGSLRHMVMRNQIPYSKIGRSVRFAKKDIDIWLEEKRAKKDERTLNETVSLNIQTNSGVEL